ncbi:polymer-forming cytoskeletal protein [Enterococcus sp. AZ126]|uniref:polymer-forming cytoskeletal protein n=1 Tax=Enterococcus sp. AZ126 TaxID=2774635 RepID=UPI003F27E193
MISKKLIAFGTLAATVLVLGACSSDNKDSKDSSSDSKMEETSMSSSVDTVSGASISDKPEVIEKALGKDGNWIVAATADITFDKDVTVSGEFHDKGETSGDIYRKLALYAQDSDHKVTDEYTLTVPKMTVETENFNIVNGTVKGDILVKANGFVLNGTKVDGKVTFEKEEYKTSATLDKEGAEVTGDVTVQ